MRRLLSTFIILLIFTTVSPLKSDDNISKLKILLEKGLITKSELKKALQECQRVAKYGYIAVESYRNEKELFNLQCWALTCASFFSKKEWEWIFKEYNYKGDYEFIYFR